RLNRVDNLTTQRGDLLVAPFFESDFGAGKINSAADLETAGDPPILPRSPTSPPEDAAMAMTNAERQQRYRDKRTRERTDAVTRALVPLRADPVTPATVAAPQAMPAMVSEAARVDLEALRRDIIEWTKLQATLNHAEARQRSFVFRSEIARYIFLIITAAFYVLLACAAIGI